MRIADMSWSQVEARAAIDDRCAIPLGSTEQHAGLSLSVDSILSERVALEAAEPLGVPVFPVQPYGLTPNFVDFPGTVSLRASTYLALVADLLDGARRSGFRRVTLVNGHGGNVPAQGAVAEWLDRNRGCEVKWIDWWRAPRTLAKVTETDAIASHASWMENFPWTRLPNAGPVEAEHPDVKPPVDLGRLARLDPAAKKVLLGDGNYGGRPARPDGDMLAIWAVAVEEVREAIEGPWG